MHLRVCLILLATTLLATSSVAQQTNAFCPPDVAQIYLENGLERAKLGAPGENNEGVHQHRPAFFASPLIFNGPLSAALNGTWTENQRKWQICLVAPPTAGSLIVIYDNLNLPLGSRLEITSSGGSKETLTAFDDGGFLFKRQKPTKSMAGNALLLTFTAGRKLGFISETPSTLQAQEPLLLQQMLQPNIVIKAILQTKLPFGASQSSSTRRLSAASKEKPSDADSLTNSKDFLAETVELSTEQIGASTACFQNAECVPWLEKARRSAVLLMLVSEFGGRFCTGSFINSPTTDENEPLILTANHCRETDDDVTIASSWGVILDNEEACSTENSAAAAVRRMLLSEEAAVVSTKQVIQGLEVVFSDEQSDVMVLRLKNPIPQGKINKLFNKKNF
jgi:hypothetical protein